MLWMKKITQRKGKLVITNVRRKLVASGAFKIFDNVMRSSDILIIFTSC